MATPRDVTVFHRRADDERVAVAAERQPNAEEILDIRIRCLDERLLGPGRAVRTQTYTAPAEPAGEKLWVRCPRRSPED
jgi:hypothetical protein